MIKQRDEFFKRSQAAQIAATQAQGVQSSRSSRKPLTDEQVYTIIASNVTITDPHLLGAVYMAIREVEAAHGIGGEE